MKRIFLPLVIITALFWSCQNEADYLTNSPVEPGSGILKSGPIETWTDVFDPTIVRSLYIRMTTEDWNTIRYDATNDIEKKAWFRAENEEKILVSIRRKSSRAMP